MVVSRTKEKRRVQEETMRNSKVIIVLFLLGMVPILLGGCFLFPEKTRAVLSLNISPNVVSIGQTLNLTFTLREHEGVGVTLNFLREEGYDQANNLLWDIEFTDQQAQGIFQNIFGTHYVIGHGILSGMTPSLLTSAFPGRGVCIFGGIDDNGHSVEASAEVTIQP